MICNSWTFVLAGTFPLKLQDAEIAALYRSDSVPQDGLVAEYLLTQDVVPDIAGAHDGIIYQATWIPKAS